MDQQGQFSCVYLVSPPPPPIHTNQGFTVVLAWSSIHQPSVAQVLGLKGGTYMTTHSFTETSKEQLGYY